MKFEDCLEDKQKQYLGYAAGQLSKISLQVFLLVKVLKVLEAEKNNFKN